MNELYRAKDNDGPRVPPIVPLPKLPPLDDHISFKRSTALIIVILIGIMMFGIMFYKDYQYAQVDASTNLKVYCEPPLVNAWRPTVENNMQAAHTYTEQISTKDTQYCFKVDDVGTLFGSSMQPTFFEGNTILLKNYTINMTLKTGDIIRFFRFNEDYPNCTSLEGFIANNSLGGSWVRNDMAVIHRVNAVYQDNVLAQGDNLYEQEQLQKCQITDVAVGIIFT